MEIITDKDKALSILKGSRTGQQLGKFSDKLRDDSYVVMKAVSIHGNALKFASKHLSNNLEIVRCAVDKNPLSFQYAGDEVKKNRAFILEILDGTITMGQIFKFCDSALQADRSFAIEFVKKNAFGLLYFPSALKADREVALLALDTNEFSFQYIKKQLRNEKEITKKALGNPYNFGIIAPKYRNDEEMSLIAVKNLVDEDMFSVFKNLGPSLKNNRDFFLKVIAINKKLFRYASDELKSDCDLLKIVLEKSDCKIDYPYANVKELLAPQIKRHLFYLNFASQEMLNDRGIILEVLKKNVNYINYASVEIQNMLGSKKQDYVEKLEKIISIEALANKLDNSLDKDEKSKSLKMKI